MAETSKRCAIEDSGGLPQCWIAGVRASRRPGACPRAARGQAPGRLEARTPAIQHCGSPPLSSIAQRLEVSAIQMRLPALPDGSTGIVANSERKGRAARPSPVARFGPGSSAHAIQHDLDPAVLAPAFLR